MKINKAGVELVKHFEGLKLKAYLCPANVWTIGYGCTDKRYAYKGNVITEGVAERLLKTDMREFEGAVERYVSVPLNWNQFSALVSFSFNVGAGALNRSTLLKKLNAGDYKGAAGQFCRWNRGGGKVLKGLIRRRAAEKKLFETPIDAGHPGPTLAQERAKYLEDSLMAIRRQIDKVLMG